MKQVFRWLVFVCLIMCIGFLVIAQANAEDIVYLKNGSIIHGTILEIIPGQSIKIQTSDRNILVYKMEEAEKISKNYPDLKESNGNYIESKDVVYLKNGSVIHGNIREIILNQTIKIQTADHNIFVFKMEEVEKISKYYSEIKEKKENNSVSIFTVGYFSGIGDASLDGYTQKNGYHALSIRMATGSKINKDVSYGIGIGYEHYSGDINYLPSTNYIPIFLDLRIAFTSTGDFRPGIIFDFGYDLGLTVVNDINAKFGGGIFVNPSINLVSPLNSKTAFLFNFGYEFQSHSVSSAYGSYNGRSLTLESSFITFRTGLEF